MNSPLHKQLEEQLAGLDDAERVGCLFDFLTTRGQSNYDESVKQIEHALQCAHLAQKRNAPAEAVTAALFHDIGHLLLDEHDDQEGFLDEDLNHEESGAELLEAHFPPQVTEPIRLHVAAKRYLCTVDPTYYDRLSDASKRSFALQGGPLSDEERSEYEDNPHLETALMLRRLDDLGKRPGWEVPGIEAYTETVTRCLLRKDEG